jgi:hypothetical protein
MRWIRTVDVMPEYDVDVHLWAEGWPRVYLGYWRHSNEWIGRNRPEVDDELPNTNPTHWMPIPDPPDTHRLNEEY